MRWETNLKSKSWWCFKVFIRILNLALHYPHEPLRCESARAPESSRGGLQPHCRRRCCRLLHHCHRGCCCCCCGASARGAPPVRWSAQFRACFCCTPTPLSRARPHCSAPIAPANRQKRRPPRLRSKGRNRFISMSNTADETRTHTPSNLRAVPKITSILRKRGNKMHTR